MHVPAGMTEADVLTAIEHVVRVLSGKIKVPGHDLEDLAQEQRMMALEALVRYDPQPDATGRPTRPLENFVYIHVKNRTLNLRRKLFRRADAPCARCHRGDWCEDGQMCRKYRQWKERNDRKASLAAPLSLTLDFDKPDVDTPDGSRVEEEAEFREMLLKIDTHLSVDLRPTYLLMRAGRPVPKSQRMAVEQAVRAALGLAAA
jgi:hypothetical protein